MKPVDVYYQSLLDAMRLDEKKESYIKRSLSDLRVFDRWLDQRTPDDRFTSEKVAGLSKEDYKAFIRALNTTYSDGSTKRICTVVAKLLQHHEVKYDFRLQDLLDTPKSFPLKKKDFVTDQEYQKLIDTFYSSENVPDAFLSAHKELAERNVSMIMLMRVYGLSGAQISKICMKDINFSDDQLTIRHQDGQDVTYTLSLDHKRLIYSYLKKIPENRRPWFKSDHPLFVAYNNQHMMYQYDNENQVPKRLAERSIIKLLHVEVMRADLRSISATNLRNRAILDYLAAGYSDAEATKYFAMDYRHTLRRYRKYLDVNKEGINV
ncbi:hypothetical protein ACMG4J_22700 [Rossellomorea marisflavi]|uniref:hypothetical protein n=1 Tax=Rossellomorea marisflavi TaxID=189381 RepID=UPI0039BF21CB